MNALILKEFLQKPMLAEGQVMLSCEVRPMGNLFEYVIRAWQQDTHA